ncbi:MAG: DNA repair protein RadA [Gammaproteobacteria bacterium]
MAKTKINFVCQTCGACFPKWAGQCTECQAWNSLIEEVIQTTDKNQLRKQGYAGSAESKIIKLTEVPVLQQERWSTTLSELDRALGGGLVAGSIVLIGGDPGIGKSTLLLQTLSQLSQEHNTVYVTGEESLQQVSLRARRLGLPTEQLKLLTETCVETIIDLVKDEKPSIMVIDSIQTIYTDLIDSAPGSVSQIRESAAQLVQFAKKTGTALFLVGHVTKEGHLAGPRVLEHMVDTVLYFEGESHQRFRVLRAIKNRFGAVNELGVFAMTEGGLKEITNPSAIFLSRYKSATPGSSILVTWEGSRPLLVEVQALVDQSHLGNPRRVAVGLDQNRLSMLLAVLHRHGGIATYDQDVFINVVGGMRVSETAADLALQLAILSSLRNQPLNEQMVIFGEVGLAGEIRPVQNGLERLREAEKHGFKKAIVPKANLPKNFKSEIEIFPVSHLKDAIQAL